jgi:hypothetical protein
MWTGVPTRFFAAVALGQIRTESVQIGLGTNNDGVELHLITYKFDISAGQNAEVLTGLRAGGKCSKNSAKICLTK